MTAESFDRARRLLEKHQHLRALLANMEEFFAQEPQELADTTKITDDLIAELKLHFLHEEEGGYFAEALAQAPRLTTRASELKQQHRELLKRVRELYEQAQQGDGSAAWWSSLRVAYQSLSEQIRAHELGENDLVQEAFTEDIGTHD